MTISESSLKAVAETPEGRKLLSEILDSSGFYQDTNDQFEAGRRSVGVELYNKMFTTDVAYVTMMLTEKEGRNRDESIRHPSEQHHIEYE